MTQEFSGRVALVTAAASGIGRRVAEMLGERGARLALFDANEKGLAEVRDQLAAAGCDVAMHAGDASDDRVVERVAAATNERFGRIDLLLNGVGIIVRKNLLDTTPEEWRRVIDVDLNSHFYLLRSVVPRMREGGGGAIVQVASIAAHIGFGYPSYTAAKGALLALTRQVAAELAPLRIRINSVSPGPTDTGLNRDTMGNPAIRQSIIANTPTGRPGLPQDVAAAVLFLLSDAAAHITGADLVIDGGMMSTIHWGSAGGAFHSFHTQGGH